MMGIFDKYTQELPPFKEYLELMYEKKQMKVITRKPGTKSGALSQTKTAAMLTNKENRPGHQQLCKIFRKDHG